jgi:uncharacterized membrane protein YdjX (TVP38/TMEM64 family)
MPVAIAVTGIIIAGSIIAFGLAIGLGNGDVRSAQHRRRLRRRYRRRF